MEEDEEHVCPICWEGFTNPKLLPCRHSFCAACLETLIKPGGEGGVLSCPMCRSSVNIPENGVVGFMGNYFLPNTEKKKEESSNNCDMCILKNCTSIKVCPHCKQKMCLSCSASHKKALILSGTSVLNIRSESDSESDSEEQSPRGSGRRRDSYDAPMPLNLAFSLHPIKCKKVIGLVSSFTVDILPDQADRQFINFICPISNKDCWVVATLGPSLLQYDISGTIKHSVPIHSGDSVNHIEYLKDGSLLIAMIWSSQIIKYFAGELTRFASTGDLHPFSLSSFPDGRIAAVGPLQSKQGNEECGLLQILSRNGRLLNHFGGKSDKKLLKDPYSVVVNKNCLIFVCDRGKHCVLVLSEKGAILKQYEGGRPGMGHRFLREPAFDPLSACSDIYGHVIVNDLSSGVLHLLDSKGDFLGLVLSNKPEGFGHPFSIATDQEGKIWIGDRRDKKIRVYECKAFVNNFGTTRLDVPFPMYRPSDF